MDRQVMDHQVGDGPPNGPPVGDGPPNGPPGNGPPGRRWTTKWTAAGSKWTTRNVELRLYLNGPPCKAAVQENAENSPVNGPPVVREMARRRLSPPVMVCQE